MKTYQQKYEEEMKAHQETISRFQDDKKKVLMSTEDANRNLVKGRYPSLSLLHPA